MRKTSLDMVYKLAKEDPRIVFIGSDLGPGILDAMKKEMPKRFYMEGVSEQHVIGMAAGLAMEGFVPYINTIATFLTRRCYEQIALDLCLQNLPVRLIANGGGVVYAPLGPTHLATEDIAILRVLPNMTIVAPCDADEMKRLMPKTLDWPHPIYIRLGKGGERVVSRPELEFEIGKAVPLLEPGDALIVSTGVMTQVALEAVDLLRADGIHCGVLHMHTIKPLDEASLLSRIPEVKVVLSVEEHSRSGGLGSAILEFCNDRMPEQAAKLVRIGIPDRFADQYGSQESLLKHWGLTRETLAAEIHSRFKD